MQQEMNHPKEQYPVPEAFRRQARVSGREAYDRLYTIHPGSGRILVRESHGTFVLACPVGEDPGS